jgi:hypothetical protein
MRGPDGDVLVTLGLVVMNISFTIGAVILSEAKNLMGELDSERSEE